jgi:sulfite reductase alpha subunit-like flavoprotein
VESDTPTRLDLAFSRDGTDGEPKVCVQQRMRENSAELFSWLQDGAHVHVALVGGGRRRSRLRQRARRNHRYVRDVY